MKTPLIIVLILISFTSFGQQAIITLKDSTATEVTIQAHSDKELYIKGGSVPFSNIAIVNFKAMPSAILKELLIRKSIKVIVNKQGFIAVSPIPTIVDEKGQELTLNQLAFQIDKFRQQRTTGKMLQLVGVISAGAGLLMSIEDNPEKNLDLIKGLAIGGAVVSTIGIIIDIDAGHHLRFKH